MNSLIPFAICLAVFGAVVFWNLFTQDKEIRTMRTELTVLRSRMTSLEKQVGWCGDKAITIMFDNPGCPDEDNS